VCFRARLHLNIPLNFFYCIAFPPQTSPSPRQPQRPVEIPDPWSGPRTYAEDFYSGGDVILPRGQKVDPSHLGPADDDFKERFPSREAEDSQNVDEIQPPQADTCASQYRRLSLFDFLTYFLPS